MTDDTAQSEAFKQPATAWKALLTILAAFGALIVFSFVDIFALQEQERCYREARAVVQDIHELRKVAKAGEIEQEELNERAEQIKARLDDDVFRLQNSNHFRAASQGDEALLLATGRILSGAMRWEAVRRHLNFFRWGVGIAAVVAFAITIISLIITAWGKEDPLQEIAKKAPVILTWSIRGVVSIPACVTIALLFVVLIFLFGDMHFTAEVLKEDINHSYLLKDFVTNEIAPSATAQASPKVAEPDTSPPPNP